MWTNFTNIGISIPQRIDARESTYRNRCVVNSSVRCWSFRYIGTFSHTCIGGVALAIAGITNIVFRTIILQWFTCFNLVAHKNCCLIRVLWKLLNLIIPYFIQDFLLWRPFNKIGWFLLCFLFVLPVKVLYLFHLQDSISW